MRNPEHIRPAEHLRPIADEQSREMIRISPTRVREITEARERTLASLRGIIDASFEQALERKLAYEKVTLLELAEREQAALVERKRASSRLRSEYFTLMPLDTELL